MQLPHDQFQCTVQGQTKQARDNRAQIEAKNYYGEQSFHVVEISPARKATPSDYRLASKSTYEADYLFEEGPEHPANI